MEFLKDAKYAKTHEWAQFTSENTATIGISDFAQKELGGIVFVNLPQIGDTVEAGETFADIESVKAVSDIYSPISGTVCEINEALLDNPEMLNQSPYESWMVKVENAVSSDELMDCEQYQEFISQN